MNNLYNKTKLAIKGILKFLEIFSFKSFYDLSSTGIFIVDQYEGIVCR